jgi:hypothetical protein
VTQPVENRALNNAAGQRLGLANQQPGYPHGRDDENGQRDDHQQECRESRPDPPRQQVMERGQHDEQHRPPEDTGRKGSQRHQDADPEDEDQEAGAVSIGFEKGHEPGNIRPLNRSDKQPLPSSSNT